MEKESSAAGQCLWTVLRYWPATNPAKELLFLNELEEVVDLAGTGVF